MEDQFDHPMLFEEAQVLPIPLVVGQDVGAWGEGVALYGAAQRLQVPEHHAYTDGQHVWVQL